MLNRTEYLLNLVQEECAEVAQRASKCMRFGLDESREDKPTNIRLLCEEFYDLMCVFDMLNKELDGQIEKQFTNQEALDWETEKIQKVEKYFKYSIEQGCAG
jgi:hypothetical protein